MEQKERFIEMKFHCAGVVSTENLQVMEEDALRISLKRGEDTVWIFTKKTGKCINDNNFGGAYRTITPIN